MNHGSVERAQFFMAQQRWEEAIRELRMAIVSAPDVGYLHALLALCLTEAGQHREALQAAQRAVVLEPTEDFSHYVLASVLEDLDRFPEAERAVREAIRLDTVNPHYFARLGSILLQQSRWVDALHAAEIGLRLDSQDVTCTNIRAMALVHMGRQDHAHRAIDTALSYEPENAVTHANRGWALMHQNRPKEAFDHFREALRLDPNQAWAREGIIQAMRARNPIYRTLLAFFLWSSRLNSGARTGLIIGLWFGNQIVRDMAHRNPTMAPTLNAISLLYLVFVFLCWTAEPLFDLLLRMDPMGQLALTREKIVVSNYVGALLFAALACVSVALQTGNSAVWVAAGVCGSMILPVAGSFGARARRRPWLKWYTITLGLVGLGAVFQEATVGNHGYDFLGLYLLGFVAYTWVGGIMSSR